MRKLFLGALVGLSACSIQARPPAPTGVATDGQRLTAQFSRCVNLANVERPETMIEEAVSLVPAPPCPRGMTLVDAGSWSGYLLAAEKARGLSAGEGRMTVEGLALGTLTRLAAPAASPTSPQPSAAEIVQARREADLVQMAAARQPGLSSAIRSAAELNVDGRGRAANTRGAREAREKAIQEEEARLIQVVEAKGQAQRERAATDARYAADRQAEAVCSYRGQQTEALRPYRGLLNIDGMVANTQARSACIDMYNRTGVPPTP